MKLTRKNFGPTGQPVSELCLSTSNFARYASQEESFSILDAFRQAGGNFIQTSGICPGVNLGDGFLGMPEELLGRWLRLRGVDRADVVIATRIALTRPVIGGLATYTDLIRQCADDSIRRIGCGQLDFLVVEWTEGIAPVEESMTALAGVVHSGQVRAIIPANFPAERLRECFAGTRLAAGHVAGLQIDFSLAARTALGEAIRKLRADRQLAVLARSPLAGGHLANMPLPTGVGSLRCRDTHDQHAAIAAAAVWPELSAIARAHGRSPAQVALSWVTAHPQITSVLVSASSTAQLRNLLVATRLRLTAGDLARLDVTPAQPSLAECTG